MYKLSNRSLNITGRPSVPREVLYDMIPDSNILYYAHNKNLVEIDSRSISGVILHPVHKQSVMKEIAQKSMRRSAFSMGRKKTAEQVNEFLIEDDSLSASGLMKEVDRLLTEGGKDVVMVNRRIYDRLLGKAEKFPNTFIGMRNAFVSKVLEQAGGEGFWKESYDQYQGAINYIIDEIGHEAFSSMANAAQILLNSDEVKNDITSMTKSLFGILKTYFFPFYRSFLGDLNDAMKTLSEVRSEMKIGASKVVISIRPGDENVSFSLARKASKSKAVEEISSDLLTEVTKDESHDEPVTQDLSELESQPETEEEMAEEPEPNQEPVKKERDIKLPEQKPVKEKKTRSLPKALDVFSL